MAKKSYSEKLKDPRWQKKRLEIMGRDEFQCMNCGEFETTLLVHHRYYIYGREPWDYSDDMLVTLCEPCHKEEHEEKDTADDLIKVLKCNGFSNKMIANMARAFHNPIQCHHDLSESICEMLKSFESQHKFCYPTSKSEENK